MVIEEEGKEKEEKCRHYLGIERKINEVIEESLSKAGRRSEHLVRYWGSIDRGSGLVFDYVHGSSLKDLCRPALLAPALKASDESDALDCFLMQLMSAMKELKECKVVHRDVKPENILIDRDGKVKIIDLGSSAHLSSSWFKRNVGLSQDKVAVSPIFAAPELFIEERRSPYAFDVFSVSFLFLCFVFRLGHDEKLMSSFRGQLADVDYNLSLWLQQQLKSTILPGGVVEGLEYMKRDEGGTWRLMERCLAEDPDRRPGVDECLASLEVMQSRREGGGTAAVLQNPSNFLSGIATAEDEMICAVPDSSEGATDVTRHIAHFAAGRSLGLVLEEDAMTSEVKVIEVAEGGQAERLAQVKVGDVLREVGGMQVVGGYDEAVNLIATQPSSIISLTFVRTREGGVVGSAAAAAAAGGRGSSGGSGMSDIGGLGRFRSKNLLIGSTTSKGRRKHNEDRIIRKMFKAGKLSENKVLVGGVFDGHGGTAASEYCEEAFVKKFIEAREEPGGFDANVGGSLLKAWEGAVEDYLDSCRVDEQNCSAEYDSVFGIVKGFLTSSSIPSGTTACVSILEGKRCYFLNCGDSRAVLCGENGRVKESTVDHRPDEYAELQRLRKDGFDDPVCGPGGHTRINVYTENDCWQYAVSRSLEGGQMCIEAGISNEGELTVFEGVQEGDFIIVATDGLWDVFDNESAGIFVANLLSDKVFELEEIASKLCSEAIRLGSTDNVSCVVMLSDVGFPGFSFVGNL